MEKLKFVTISKDIDISGFDCGEKYINNFFKQKALHNFFINESSTKLLMFEGELLGFYTVKIDILKYKSDKYNEDDDYKIIYLESIAVDKKHQNNGFGQYILDYFIDNAKKSVEFLGLIGVMLKAIPDKRSWYEGNGFSFVKKAEYDLDLMLLDTRTSDYFEYYESLSY